MNLAIVVCVNHPSGLAFSSGYFAGNSLKIEEILGFCDEEWWDYCAVGSVAIEPLSRMTVLQTYYDIPKVLLDTLGLWPYDRPKFVIIKNISLVFIVVSFIIPQCFVFVTTTVTVHLVLKNLSPLVMSSGAVLHYVTFWYKNDTIKQFLKEVEHDWQTNDKEALEILKKNTLIGRHHAKFYISFIYPSAVILIILDISNYVMHVVAPSNGTYVFNFPITMEYFIDERKYYLLVVTHQCLSIFILATIYSSTEALNIMLLQHIAGLFAITSNLIERAVLEDVANFKSNDTVSIKSSKATFVTAVSVHRRALSFSNSLKDYSKGLYSMLIIMSIVSLSANFYRLSLSMFRSGQIEESLTASMFSISVLAYMFYLNYMVQHVMDRAMDVAPLLYETPWYDTSIGIRKLLLIFMMKSSEEITAVFYASYQASVEGFSLMLKKSVSALMIMISLQER